VRETKKMETVQNVKYEELNLNIGAEEAATLKPAVVEIVGVNVEEVGKDAAKKSKKVVFTCQHPDSQDTIRISEAKYERQGQLKFSGTWLNKDNAGKIQKGSALAALMVKCQAATPAELLNKKLDTVADDKGYLAFKAY
jgi:hypothetical protein